MYDAFRFFDRQNKGFIGVNQLREAFNQMGLDASDDDIA